MRIHLLALIALSLSAAACSPSVQAPATPEKVYITTEGACLEDRVIAAAGNAKETAKTAIINGYNSAEQAYDESCLKDLEWDCLTELECVKAKCWDN